MYALGDLCIPCQAAIQQRRNDPDMFEGPWWTWSYEKVYAPVQMVWGTLQSRHIRHTAKRAWESFCHDTHKTKEELIADGYRVKCLRITPRWGANKQICDK